MKKMHGLFSNTDFSNIPDEKAAMLQTYFASPRFTPSEYRDLLSGKYHDDYGWGDHEMRHALDLLSNHRHNNTKNNDKILKELIKRGSTWKNYAAERMVSKGRLSKEALLHAAREADSEALLNIDENPNFDGEVLEAIVNRPEIPLRSALIDRPEMTKALLQTGLKKRHYDFSKATGAINSPHFDSDMAEQMLSSSALAHHSITDDLLSKMPEERRHKYIKDKLGMTGGEIRDEDEEHWDNWENGPEHKEKIAENLSHSKHLSPDEIEHIKRHGNFDQKWALLHNGRIDPKHAIEMISKWDADDSHHGYDEDELKEKLREEHGDSKWDWYNDSATEAAADSYPMSEYISDNYDDDELSDLYFDMPKNEWKRNWILENKDTTGPNPGYSPQVSLDGSQEPQTIDFRDEDHPYHLDDHPDFNSWDDEADTAFKNAIDNADTPDRLYEGYDESIRDSVDREVYNLFDEDISNWTAQEHLLPKHVTKALKKPWDEDSQVTDEQLQAGLKHPLAFVREQALRHPSLSSDLISQILKTGNRDEVKAVLNHPNFNSDHISQILSDPNATNSLVEGALSSAKVRPEHISQVIASHPDNEEIMRTAFDSHAANEEHARQLLGMDRSKNRRTAHYAISPALNLSPEDLTSAFHNNEFAAGRVMNHPNVTNELVQAGLNHESWSTREAAKKRQNVRFPTPTTPINVKTGTHPLRIMRDFIDQHGGTITKSKLKGMGVNTAPIDKLFNSRGQISSADIQKFIDQSPGTSYNTSHGTWDGAQRHSAETQPVFQLNYTQDQVDQMAKAGVLGTFEKIHQMAHNSSHPVRTNTIGWVRYTGNPKEGFHIDEIQSDFGQSMIKKVAAQAKEALRTGAISEEGAEEAMKRARDYYPEEHVDQITKILFGNKHPSEILHEGFKEYMRLQGHSETPIHIWQPESKAPISGQKTSVFVQPSSVDGAISEAKEGNVGNHAKALIGWGQKQKIIPGNYRDIKPEHLDALGEHYKKFAASLGTESDLPELPLPLPVHMQEGYGKIPKAMKYQEATYGELPTQSNEEYKGQPTFKDVIRKSEVDQSTRMKIALTLKTIDENKDVWQQLQQSNPQAYQSVMGLVQSLVEMFKKKSGEDPETAIHELEIQQQLEEQQQQMQAQQQGQPGQPQQQGQPSQPNQDQPLHRRQMVYAPGSIRNYTPQDARIKQDDGEWKSFGGGLQDPVEGQSE